MEIKIKTHRGDIKISGNALVKIVASIACSCYGVLGLSGGGKGSVLNRDNITKMSRAIKIKFENEKITVNIHIVTAYGININSVSESIRSGIKYQLENFTGVEVSMVNVYVELLDMVD